MTSPGVSAPTTLRGANLDPADAQQVFRTVLAAMSRPGIVQVLPDGPLRTLPAAMLPVLALADLETGVCVLGTAHDWPTIVRTATSAPSVPLPEARLVAALDGLRPEELLAARRGSAEAPETAALVSIAVSDIELEATKARLEGPGIDGSAELPVALAPELIEARAQALAELPSGVDLLLVAPDGRLIAIPRSTRISERGE